MNTEDKFALGVVSMARNCQAAIKLVRSGKWTIDEVDSWLNSVIENDFNLLEPSTICKIHKLGQEPK